MSDSNNLNLYNTNASSSESKGYLNLYTLGGVAAIWNGFQPATTAGSLFLGGFSGAARGAGGFPGGLGRFAAAGRALGKFKRGLLLGDRYTSPVRSANAGKALHNAFTYASSTVNNFAGNAVQAVTARAAQAIGHAQQTIQAIGSHAVQTAMVTTRTAATTIAAAAVAHPIATLAISGTIMVASAGYLAYQISNKANETKLAEVTADNLVHQDYLNKVEATKKAKSIDDEVVITTDITDEEDNDTICFDENEEDSSLEEVTAYPKTVNNIPSEENTLETLAEPEIVKEPANTCSHTEARLQYLAYAFQNMRAEEKKEALPVVATVEIKVPEKTINKTDNELAELAENTYDAGYLDEIVKEQNCQLFCRKTILANANSEKTKLLKGTIQTILSAYKVRKINI
ncbi:MAG: hypothetical protein ABSA84_04180 [Gammaproteobacteria bacterium]